MDSGATGMTDLQFNSFLELIAKLIEASANNVADAVRIIREAKIPAE